MDTEVNRSTFKKKTFIAKITTPSLKIIVFVELVKLFSSIKFVEKSINTYDTELV
jgi:hypothetical protein